MTLLLKERILVCVTHPCFLCTTQTRSSFVSRKPRLLSLSFLLLLLPPAAMDQSSTPRVSCPYLSSYVGRNVLVVGRIVQLRGDSAIVDADGQITVHLNRVCAGEGGGVEEQPMCMYIVPHSLTAITRQESHLIAGNAAQIVGKITPDLSIKVLSAQDLGLDVGAYFSGGLSDHFQVFPHQATRKEKNDPPPPSRPPPGLPILIPSLTMGRLRSRAKPKGSRGGTAEQDAVCV